MIRRAYFLVILLIVLPVLCSVAAAQDPGSLPAMDLVLDRYRQQLLRETPLASGAIDRLLDRQQPDGAWPDLNYQDDRMGGWEPREHMVRLSDMALAYASPGHPRHGSPEVLKGIHLGLDHWLEHRYQSANWWFNEIGIPRFMRDVVILMGANIEGARREKALSVIDQHKLRGTGANLAWNAELAFHLACLIRDPDRAGAAATKLWNEVTVGRPEGIQPDWSFYQHGPRLQSFHYGRAFLDVAAQTAWQLRGTPWQIPTTQRDYLSNYLLEGQQWMCRGIYTVPGTMDRMVSRKDALAEADLRAVLELWKDVDPDRRDALAAFHDRQSTPSAAQLNGFRAFPYGDFFVWHQPQFSIFLKTISSRTQITESINSENLKGVPYLHNGDHYLLRTGEEYFNLPPLWEWDRLPGLTTAPGLDQQKRLPFTGGAGNGPSGVVAMDYLRTSSVDDQTTFHARKLWSFHDGIAVCLIAGVESAGVDGEIVTALEQCHLTGPVVWKPAGAGAAETIPPETQRTEDAAWALHRGVGYVPLSATARLSVDTRTRTGSWKTINAGHSDTPVSAPVFALQMQHGDKLGADGYAIVGNATEQSLEKIVSQPPWTVIRNDSVRQHLRFTDGLQMAAFYQPLEPAATSEISVDAPCLALWNDDHLWICDPTHTGRTVKVTRANRTATLTLPPAGAVVRHAWK